MTSTINASTSSGIVQTADTSGVLALQSNGTTALTVGPGAAISTTNTIDTPGVSLGFKNRIINGGMTIDQRNAGASVTPTTGSYTLDRWGVYCSAASKFTVQQNAGSVTPPAGFTKYAGVTSSSSYTIGASEIFGIAQTVEGYNLADLNWGSANAKTVTLSFWVRSSLTGQFGGFLKNGGITVGGSSNRFYQFSYTINSANTWEYKTVTILGDTTGTWDSTNGPGLSVAFSLGAGSTATGGSAAWGSAFYNQPSGSTNLVATNGATFYITGVQLEVGTAATSFEFRDYGRELIMCQRYYENVRAGYVGSAVSGAANGFAGRFIVEKRAAATITWLSNVSSLNFPSTAPLCHYLSTTARDFYYYRVGSATTQDGRYEDNYSGAAEL